MIKVTVDLTIDTDDKYEAVNRVRRLTEERLRPLGRLGIARLDISPIIERVE